MGAQILFIVSRVFTRKALLDVCSHLYATLSDAAGWGWYRVELRYYQGTLILRGYCMT